MKMSTWNEEDVCGEIYGGEGYILVQLIAPNGKPACSKEYTLATVNIGEWGAARKREILNKLCGNGIPLKNYPDIVSEIYGNGEWWVKVYH